LGCQLFFIERMTAPICALKQAQTSPAWRGILGDGGNIKAWLRAAFIFFRR